MSILEHKLKTEYFNLHLYNCNNKLCIDIYDNDDNALNFNKQQTQELITKLKELEKQLI